MNPYNIEEYYENLTKIRSINYETTINALNLVKQFIVKKRLILVGGMAIDLALKLKGDRIYADDQLPDYDFYSTNNVLDAYELSKILCEHGFQDVSCIQALHVTTMRVRVGFEVVADITYCPKSVLKLVPYLEYHGLKIVHPHFQMIDQHNSLSIPFENPGREVIFHRWKKDMIRYDKLYKYYPIVQTEEERADTGTTLSYNGKKYMTGSLISERRREIVGGYTRTIDREKMAHLEMPLDPLEIKFESIKNGCVCGWGAIDYTINEKNKSIIIKIPKTEYISIASYDYESFVKDNDYSIKNYYSEYFGQLPRYVICDTKIRDSDGNTKELQVFDTYGILLSSKKISNEFNVYVVNIQWSMAYLLNRIFRKITPEVSFTAEERYLYCRDLVKSGQTPSIEVYGTDNFTPAHVNMRKKNKEKTYGIKPDQKRPLPSRPKSPDCVVKHTFNPEDNINFIIDGRKLSSFVKINLDPYPEYNKNSQNKTKTD